VVHLSVPPLQGEYARETARFPVVVPSVREGQPEVREEVTATGPPQKPTQLVWNVRIKNEYEGATASPAVPNAPT